MVTTSGSCALMVYEPSPPPSVPGSVSELRPRQPQPGITNRHAVTIAATAARVTVSHLALARVDSRAPPSGLPDLDWHRLAWRGPAPPRVAVASRRAALQPPLRAWQAADAG